jgi:hypothetical protein
LGTVNSTITGNGTTSELIPKCYKFLEKKRIELGIRKLIIIHEIQKAGRNG